MYRLADTRTAQRCFIARGARSRRRASRNRSRRLFAQDALVAPTIPGEVSLGRARELAAAFLKTFGRMFLPSLQQEYGGPIDVPSLKPCGRVFQATTPYESLPPDTPPWLQRLHGSWWLVSFCGPAQQRQVSVAVSTLATRVDISSEGRLLLPRNDQSTLFYVLGIPQSLGELPPEPEHAVIASSNIAGKRVIGPPRLIAPAIGTFPQSARWQSMLDGSAVLPSAAPSRATNTIYYGVESFLDPPFAYVASDEQPESTDYTLSLNPRQSVTARRKAELPVTFDKILLTGR